MDSIYHERIIDHYRNPRNKGCLKAPTHEASSHNPTCGDRLSLALTISRGRIKEIGWTGEGCAISQASVSLLSEFLLGKTPGEAIALSKEDLLSLLGIELSPTRLKCALLSLETLRKALHNEEVNDKV